MTVLSTSLLILWVRTVYRVGGILAMTLLFTSILFLWVRGPTGNGAKFNPACCAFTALCSGRKAGLNLSFPAPFLCYFLLALKESKGIILGEQKMNKALMQQRHVPYHLERLAVGILALNIPYIYSLLT